MTEHKRAGELNCECGDIWGHSGHVRTVVNQLAAAQARADELQARADETETQLNRLLPVVEGATGGFKDTIKSLLDYKDRAEAAEQQVAELRAALIGLAGASNALWDMEADAWGPFITAIEAADAVLATAPPAAEPDARESAKRALMALDGVNGVGDGLHGRLRVYVRDAQVIDVTVTGSVTAAAQPRSPERGVECQYCGWSDEKESKLHALEDAKDAATRAGQAEPA